MKLYLLSSDSDTLTGLRLAGIDGSMQYPQQIDALKRNAGLLVTEIPDMEHPTVDTDSITRYVAAAVGTKM